MKSVFLAVIVLLSINLITAIHIDYQLNQDFGLRIDAFIYNTQDDIIFRWYRSDGVGDVLEKYVKEGIPETHIYRLNPETEYVVEAWNVRTGEAIDRDEIITGKACSEQMTDDFIRIESGRPTFDLLVAEQQIQYKMFAFDKYGYIAWCCENCGPVNTIVYTEDSDEENFFAVQDRDIYDEWITIAGAIEDPITLAEDAGNIKKMSLSGETIKVIDTSKYGFYHEITADPNDIDVVWSFANGEKLGDVEPDAVMKGNFEENTYEKIVDFGDWFDPIKDRSVISKDGDPQHANSICISPINDDIVVSLKSISTIAAYDYKYGTEQWRLSTMIQSDFSFANDYDKFYCQHDASILENGHLLLFDNGNVRREENHGQPQESRGAEYELDFETMTATLVWDFWLGGYSEFRGSCRRMPNGNTIIYCAKCTDNQGSVWEVDANQNEVAFISWPIAGLWYSYRAQPIESINGEYILATQEEVFGNSEILKKNIKTFSNNV